MSTLAAGLTGTDHLCVCCVCCACVYVQLPADFSRLHLADDLHPQVTHVSSSHSGCSITSDSGSSSLSDIYQVSSWSACRGPKFGSRSPGVITPPNTSSPWAMIGVTSVQGLACPHARYAGIYFFYPSKGKRKSAVFFHQWFI